MKSEVMRLKLINLGSFSVEKCGQYRTFDLGVGLGYQGLWIWV